VVGSGGRSSKKKTVMWDEGPAVEVGTQRFIKGRNMTYPKIGYFGQREEQYRSFGTFSL